MNKKSAFVTGGGGYIGSEVARALAKDGYAVAVADINLELAERVACEIREAGGEAIALELDVTSSESVNTAIASTAGRFGTLDVSVHVAGGSERLAGNGHYVPFYEQEDAVIDKVIGVNLIGAMYVSRAAAKIMVEQNRGGRIINFSSIVGLMGLSKCTTYATAKAGVVGFTRSLAKDVGQYGITVNAIAPGVVERPDVAESEFTFKSNFLGKKCLATDVADLTSFIASDRARFITGQVHVIDGGRSLAMKGSD